MPDVERLPPTPWSDLSAKIQSEIHAPDPDDASTIWKYLDLAKLVWLLSEGRLFFTRTDCLGDAWEGAATAGTLAARDESATALAATPSATEWRDHVRKKFGMSCWYVGDGESQAMWRLYADRGVAVVSTMQRLRRALQPENQHDVLSGRIHYVDHGSAEAVNELDPAVPLFMKNSAFVYEREFRMALHWQPQRPEIVMPAPGVGVDVDLTELIEGLVLSPVLRAYEASAVRAIAAQYKVSCVRASALREPNPQ